MTVLYDYWRSSASYRVRIALNLAGIAHQLVPMDLAAGAQKTPDHLARNPQGLVPVLEIDGLRLTQSLAIIEYLNDRHGLNLLPDDPGERARVRAVAHAIAVDIHPVCNLGVVAHVAELAPSPTVKTDWMRRFIHPGLCAVERLLAGFEQAPFATGSRLSLVDLCLIPQLYNATRWDVPLDGMPRISAVGQACNAHPAFVAAAPKLA